MVLEQAAEGFHLVAITFLCCFGKHFGEDALGKLLRVVTLGLFGQLATHLGFVQLVVDALHQHTVFLGEVTPEHHVHLIDDV